MVLESKDYVSRYRRLANAIHSAVAYSWARHGRTTSPERQRTSSVLVECDQAALVELLVEKGVFTKDELREKYLKFLEREKEDWEAKYGREFGGVGEAGRADDFFPPESREGQEGVFTAETRRWLGD